MIPPLYFDVYYRNSQQQHDYTPSWLSEENKQLFRKTIAENEALILYCENNQVIIQGLSVRLANYLYRKIFR